MWTVLVHGQNPVANFNASVTSGCSPLKVTFNDQSTGNPTSWSWDFGNGQLSTVQNPTVSYSQPGTYTVRLIVKNDSGIDDEIKTDYITVFQGPKASFTANMTTSCEPGTIQFTDLSTAPAGSSVTSWSWNFGDEGTSAQQNPSHTYTNTGFYTVSLQVTSSTGCKSTITIGRYIRIVNGVDVDFAYSQPATCRPPFMINFQDQSSGPGTLSYSWSFGNGANSTSKNPSTTYPSAGTYQVHLTVQSNLGCSGAITKDIVVAGKTTDFTFPSTICIGQEVNFKNNSSPSPVSSLWTFSDGTSSSQINPVKTFLAGGSFKVKLINNYGNCSDSITKTVTVITSPTVDFSANDSTACDAPFTVQFTDKSPGASSWLWDFGDGMTSTLQNPSHTYSSSGFYDVTLSITLVGGCSNTITKPQYIKIKQTTVAISNAPAGGCIPFTYSPIASIQSVDSIISYSWDFGDGGSSTVKNPTHTYNSAGSYDLQLTITTQSGCVKTLTIPNGVRTGTKPTADFSFTPNGACASTPVKFTDLSPPAPGANVEWNWDFGDGSTSTLQNPTHTFQDTGNLTIRFTVLNNDCPDIISKTITVLPPVAKFGYQVNCNKRLNVTFSDSSLANPVYGPVTYQWDFGDGSPTSTLQNPTHSYSSLGVYTVTLTVTNGSCTYPTSKAISLFSEPADFSISKNPVCKNEAFILSATTSNAANISNYTWTVGTTTLTDTGRSISYRIPGYGTYDVTLTIQDINGCISSKTIPQYITVSGPVANFAPVGQGGCINKQINFNDLSTSIATITQWTWNFGDGTIQNFTSPPFSHSYAQPGSYSVSLTVKDNGNCSDKTEMSNAVLITNPVAGFRADTLYCPQAPLQFVDTSVGLALTYTWDFGDGGSSSLQNPIHSYSSANSYTIKLKIKDLAGCEDSTTKTKYINIRRPTSAFDIADSSGICLPVVTSFTFKGTDYKNFYWDFGDGATTTAQNPSHFYNLYGTYTPKLFLIGPGGCIDSAQATVNAYDPKANTQVTFNPATACNSLTANFSLTTPPGFSYKFYFGDGTFDSTQQHNLTHFYASPGNYPAFIVYSDKFGCEPSANIGTIHVYGALPLFGKSKKEFCDTGQVFFTNYTLSNDPVTSTVWDFGDGSTSTIKTPSHFFGAPGTYIVKLTVTTQNQCTSIYSDTIRVYPTPVLSISGRDTICVNSTEEFMGNTPTPDSTLKWQWNFGNGSSAQTQNVSVLYSAVGNYNIQLKGTNKLGCEDTTSHAVVVVPLPTATPVSNPITIISGASAQLNMEYTGPIVSYNWLPVQHLSCTDCPQPTANPQFTTDYKLQIQDRYGCKNSSDITVKVICNGQNFFIPNTFSPNGDGINDMFYLRGTGLFRVNSMMIFNRWGEVVFEKKNFQVNDPMAGWDGTYKGKKATPDVYIYQVEIVCDNGETMKYSGNIALIQ
jgi:gliding motility-associated-like protein